MRPISPWSTVTLKEYVDGLIAAGDRESLDVAVALTEPVPSWMVKIMTLRTKLGAEAPAATPAPCTARPAASRRATSTPR